MSGKIKRVVVVVSCLVNDQNIKGVVMILGIMPSSYCTLRVHASRVLLVSV